MTEKSKLPLESTLPLCWVVKRESRKRMKAVRQALPAQAVQLRSQKINEKIQELKEWKQANTVGLFWPIRDRNEVDIRELHCQATEQNKKVAFPSIDRDSKTMVLRYVESEQELVERGMGFQEPAAEAPSVLQREVDLIVIPALAVDPLGHRIGYGAGFYDRMLPFYASSALLIGVAFDFQLIAEVPITPGDVSVNVVITDQRVLWVQPDNGNQQENGLKF